jgi:hypothetical protein
MALWPSLGHRRKQSGISFYEIKEKHIEKNRKLNIFLKQNLKKKCLSENREAFYIKQI